VVVDEEFWVDAEGVGAIVVDRAAGAAGGEAIVLRAGVFMTSEGVDESLGFGDVAFDDVAWASADDGDGGGVMGGEVADGVEKDEAGEVGELACHFVRLSREVGGPRDEWWESSHGGFSPLT